MGRLCWTLSALAVAWSVTAAGEDTTRYVLDTNLQWQLVDLTSVSLDAVSFVDQDRVPGRLDSGSIIALLPPLQPGARDEAKPVDLGSMVDSRFGQQAGIGLIELTDGQRFVGFLATSALSPEEASEGLDALRWTHPVIGDLEFNLDGVSRVTLRAQEAQGLDIAITTDARDDALVLVNGDVLQGFINTIGEAISLETDRGVLDVPMERVAEIRLANPTEPIEGPMAWLRDGTIARLSDMAMDRFDQLTLNLSVTGDKDGPGQTIGVHEMLGVAMQPGSLLPLGEIEPFEQKPVGARRWAEPVEISDPRLALLRAADITLPGPMEVSWELPRAASRLTFIAELPPDMHAWGDCELVVEVRLEGSTTELIRQRMSRESAIVPLSTELPGEGALSRALTIRLEPGQFGPIQDRIVLHRGVLLIGQGSG